jgi:glucokinase
MESKYSVGLDLGGTALKYGFGNRQEGLVYFNRIVHEDKSLDGIIRQFEYAFADMFKRCDSFKGVCLATPGIVDSERGVVIGSTPNLPCIKSVNLKEILYKFSTFPIFIENDANIMTLAESYECNSDSVLGITIGTGIGTGFVQNKTIFRGEKFTAMEAGHTIIVPNGRQCKCGKKGCFEAYCSADSMKSIIHENFPETRDMSLNEILCSSETPYMVSLLDLFAIALSNLVMTLNPGTIVIGGGVIEIEHFDFDYLKKKVYENLSPEFRNFDIIKAKHGNKAGVIGGIFLNENI